MKRIYEYEDLQPVLDQLLEDKESNDMEFKSAKGGFPHSMWETYSSFANTDGGAIVFGIREKDDRFYLDGLTKEQVKKYEKEFFNGMHNKQIVNIPLMNENDVQAVEFGGAYCLFFYIPRVDRSLRPVYCGLDPYTGTYRRDLDGDYHCSREEVNSMFSDANIADPVDGRIMENFGKEDLDSASIMQYRRKFEQWNPDHVWNTLQEDKFLEKINVFRKDRKTGKYGLTYAGLLMFGTYSAIMDANPNFFPDYQEIEDPKDRWINRICPDGNWESNLFQFYSRVLPILQSFLPQPFILEGNQRKTETPAHVAVREALTNALVHADFTVNASLNVYKYPNKMVFSNPGTMLIPIWQFYKGGESVCRNKYLQTMFSFLGSAEKAGSGADKILHGWEKQNWKRPYLMERSRPNKVVLTMSMESLIDNNVLDALEILFSGRLSTLDHNQLLALALAYTEEEISNERLQYALEMHKADISQMLGKMCKQQFLESSGRGRGTTYHVYGIEVPPVRNMDTSKSNISKDKSNIDTSKSNILENKGNMDTLKGDSMDTSKSNMDTSKSNMDTSKSNMDTSKSNFTHPKRYSKEQLKKLLMGTCQEWMTAEEIAISLGRDTKYVKNFVLPKMTDIIEKMYENIPNHPRQKYRAKQKD